MSNRQRFGYVYPKQNQNNVAMATNNRNNYVVMTKVYDQSVNDVRDEGMSGEGAMDVIRGIYDKGKKALNVASMASDLYSSDLGTYAKNLIPSSDETARPSFAGEKHAILQLPNGKYGIANYMGPGTKLIQRLKRNDPPRTLSDKASMRHDIDFALASGLSSEAEKIKAIREADKRMVKNLDRIAKDKSDAKKNIFLGKRLIQAKMKAEDMGLMPKGSFAGKLKKIDNSDKILLKSAQDKLEQEGYGLNLPAQKLKLKLMKAHSRKNKKGKGLGLPGAGLGLPGAGKKKIDMCITKKCRLMRGQGIVDIIKSVIKTLTPMAKEIGTEAFKKVVVPYAINKIKEKLEGKKGDGLKLAGQRGKGKKGQKGGFWFLAPLIALAAEAVSGVTVASVGSALASGAATAAGAAVAKKIIGSGKMKGKGIKEVAQKVGQVLKKNKEKIIKIAESTGVLPKDLPKQIIDKAQSALDVINEVSSGKPTKEKVLGVVKMLIPHVKEAFHSKMEKKMKGSGLALPGQHGNGHCGGMMIGKGQSFDNKVLAVVKKNL